MGIVEEERRLRTHMMPKAKPFLFANHSSMYRMVGEYAKLPPTA